ncbi:MAG: hypothetical protein V4642_13400 [Bacteroidota bacterium]
MKVIITYSLAYLIFSLTGCRDRVETSKKEFLTGNSSKRWKIVRTVANGSETPVSECLKDDVLILSESGEAITKTGKLKCDPNEGEEIIGWWNFSMDSTELTLGSEISMRVKILEISNSSMKLEEIDSTRKDGKSGNIVTFVKMDN